MNYYKLLLDDSNENDVVCYCNDIHGFEQYELDEGKFIQDWVSDITFYFNPLEGDRITDYLANNLGWFVVSNRFKNVLSESGIDGIQYLPVKVINSKDNTTIDNYYVANVLHVVDALDLQNSDYSVMDIDGEKIYSIRKYVVIQDKVKNVHLFKLKGYEIPIFASELVKKLTEKNNITGCDFLEIGVQGMGHS